MHSFNQWKEQSDVEMTEGKEARAWWDNEEFFMNLETMQCVHTRSQVTHKYRNWSIRYWDKWYGWCFHRMHKQHFASIFNDENQLKIKKNWRYDETLFRFIWQTILFVSCTSAFIVETIRQNTSGVKLKSIVSTSMYQLMHYYFCCHTCVHAYTTHVSMDHYYFELGSFSRRFYHLSK